MATLGRRATAVDATNNTTWASTANCVDGSYGTTPATYGTWTNNSRNATAYIDLGGFDFSSIPAGATINSVTIYLRHYESATNLFDYVNIRMWDGGTAIGSGVNVTLSATATTYTRVMDANPTLTQLQSAGMFVRVEADRPNSTTEGVLYIDHVDVLVDYTASNPSGTGAGALAVTGGDASGAKHSNLSGTAAAAIALAGTSTGALGAFNPPTGLTATPVSTSQINVSWNPVAGATGYDLQRERWNSSAWVDLTLIEDVTSTYPDTGLSPDTLYHYRVRAKK